MSNPSNKCYTEDSLFISYDEISNRVVVHHYFCIFLLKGFLQVTALIRVQVFVSMCDFINTVVQIIDNQNREPECRYPI